MAANRRLLWGEAMTPPRDIVDEMDAFYRDAPPECVWTLLHADWYQLRDRLRAAEKVCRLANDITPDSGVEEWWTFSCAFEAWLAVKEAP